MKISLKNLVWFTYLFTALYSYTRLTEIVSFLSITKYIQLGLVVILLISTITHSVSAKRLFFMMIVLGAAIVELHIIGDVTLVFYVAFIFCVKNLECDEFIKADLWFKCSFIFAVTGACLFGLVENYTMTRADGAIRYSMGFNHPNSFAGIAISVLLEWMCIQIQKTIRFRHVVGIVLMVALVDQITNSRTFELSMLITLLLTLVFMKKKENSKLINVVYVGMPLFFVTLSFGMVLMYDGNNPNWVMIDTFVSNRISFAQNFILEYRLQLWGQNLNLVGSIQALLTSEGTHILDMGYLRFILQYGLIFSVLLIAIIMIDMAYAVKNKNITMVVLLTYLCVSAVFESTLGNPIYNYIIPVVTTGVLSNLKQERITRKERINLE